MGLFIKADTRGLCPAVSISIRNRFQDGRLKDHSLLFHSARIALNYDQAIATRGSESEERSRVCCSTSATDVTSLLRTYRTQYGLQHAPLVFVYGAVQACRSAKGFGIAEELQYLNQTLGELSSIWGLSREVLRRLG